MANRLAKSPLASYTAASPAVQGRAAYCVSTTALTGYVTPESTGFSFAAGSSSGGSRPSAGPQWVYSPPDPYNYQLTGGYVQIPDLGDYGATRSPTGGGGSVLVPQYSTFTSCYPAVAARPAVPSRVDYTQSYSWASGARSINKVPLVGFFAGTIPNLVVALQFGLTQTRFSPTYDHMPHAMVARQGSWTVVEHGVDKATGYLAPGAALEIQRRAPLVVYLVDGVEVYTSEGGLSSEDVYGATLLYSGVDAIDNPRIAALTAPAELRLAVPAPLLLGADSSVSQGVLRLPTWGVKGVVSTPRGVGNLDVVVPAPLLLVADRRLALARLVLPAPNVRGVLSRPERELTQLILYTPPPVLSATLLGGQSMVYDHPLPAPVVLGADVPSLAFGYLRLPSGLRTYAAAPYMPAGEVDGMGSMVAHDSANLDTALLLLAVDSLGVGEVEATLVVILSLSAMDSMELSDATSLGSLVTLLAMDQVSIISSTAAAQREAIQYAVNVATGALSVYEGFDFHGFANTPDATYAYRPDGLYRMESGADNGELISALMDLGATDFDANTVKHIDQVYVGVRTDGQCFVRVRADDGRERVYRVRSDKNVRRATLAKGVSGRYWSVTLEIVGASFVEVDSIELLVGATQRRGFGAKR